jgi:DNA-binding transcriptional LysR family regulator
MDRLDAMTMLVTAVDEGSLAKAARRLAKSPASITRGVALLEARAGERLLHRTTRSLKLTEAGVEQVAIFRQVLAALATTPEPKGALRGRISITAPEIFGRLKIVPLLDGFLHEHPCVSTRAVFVNRVVDMVEEGIDLAVRIARLQDSVLTAVRLGTVRRLVCASPAYLQRHGAPRTPADLTKHACIDLQVGSGHEPWQFPIRPGAGARMRTVAIGSRLSVNSQTTAIAMSVADHGLCHPLSYQLADELRDGRLVRVLENYEPEPVPVQFVFHPTQRQGGIVRSLVQMATPILRADLAAMADLTA